MMTKEKEWKDMTVDKIWNTWRQKISIDEDKWKEIKKECIMTDF